MHFLPKKTGILSFGKRGHHTWLSGWLHHIWCAILLDIIDLHMLSLGALNPEGPWCVFFATKHVYLGLTHNVVFCWYSNLISHSQRDSTNKRTYTHKETQHKQTQIYTQRDIEHSGSLHTNITIYLHHLLRAHSSYLNCIEWIIHWYQKVTFHNVFCFQELFIGKGHISVDWML